MTSQNEDDLESGYDQQNQRYQLGNGEGNRSPNTNASHLYLKDKDYVENKMTNNASTQERTHLEEDNQTQQFGVIQTSPKQLQIASQVEM